MSGPETVVYFLILLLLILIAMGVVGALNFWDEVKRRRGDG